MGERASDEDLSAIEIQLGRVPRDVHSIAYRCPCSNPAVVETNPRLSDGTPFPTFYYATCPNLTAAISSLENSSLMEEMNERLAIDAELSGQYRAAHDDYLAARAALGIDVPEIVDISAGGCQIVLNVYTPLLPIACQRERELILWEMKRSHFFQSGG